MKPLSIVASLILTLAFQTPVWSSTHYLLYDTKCMDRLEYTYPETKPGNEFVVYSFKRSATERWVFEVGAESQSIQQFGIPGNLMPCESAGILEDGYIKAINDKSAQLFIVQPTENGKYRLSLVKQAFRFVYSPDLLSAETSEYRLSLNPGGSEYPGDLSNNDTRGQVFFINKNAFQSVWTFRQVKLNPEEYLEIKINPSIGILEERNSVDGIAFLLAKINGVPYKGESISAPTAAVVNPEFTARGIESAVPTTFEWRQPTQEPSVVSVPLHVVLKGESLYSISKKYGVKVADLQSWNNLGTSTLIHPGSELALAPSHPAIQQVPKGYENSVTYTPTSSFPTNTPAWLSAPVEVVVAPNETAASLAAKYGYTEERFRYFNHLGPGTELRPGDIVKTTDTPTPTEMPTDNDNFTSRGIDTYSEKPSTDSKQESELENPYWAEFTPLPTEDAPNNPQRTSSDVPFVPGYYGPVTGDNSQVIKEYSSITGSTTTAKSGAVKKSDKQRKVHEVKPGETLEAIARRYGLSTEVLRKLNNLSPGETVIPFQRIFIN